MEINNSPFLQASLDAADQLRTQLENQYLSGEQFLLALFLLINNEAYSETDETDYQEVLSVIESNISDLPSAISALNEKLLQSKITAEDSQTWFQALRNTSAIAQQINATNISAAILLQVLLSDPPQCLRPFMKAEKEAAEKKAADMFIQTPEELHEPEQADFLNFCREARQLAPVLLAKGAEKTLTRQVFLWSIEEDQIATTTYLHMLNDLYHELGLIDYSNAPGIVAIPSDIAMDGSIPGVANFSLDKIDHMVICLDISTWSGCIDSLEFEALLLKLYERLDDFIFVFRLPFVEDAVLLQIADRIQNIFALRVLRFAPWSLDYMADLAQDYLARLGYQADNDAMKAFRIQITAEKADGLFYGYATIRKVCEEMIYLTEKNSLSSLNIADSKDHDLSNEDKDNCKVNGNCMANNDQITNDMMIHLSDVTQMAHGQLCEISSSDQLLNLIGRESVKKQVSRIMQSICQQAESDLTREISSTNPLKISGPFHMFFEGEAGTARTTIARIITRFFYEQGLLSQGIFFERRLDELIGCCEGETTPRALAALRDSSGSLLLIDELTAPVLPDNASEEDDPEEEEDLRENFRSDALNTLISQLPYHTEDFVLIFAGTEQELQKLENEYPELEGLIPYTIHFDAYSDQELPSVFMDMVMKKNYQAEPGLEETVRDYFSSLPARVRNDSSFTNARYISNLFDSTISKTAVRSLLDGSSPKMILSCDFLMAARDSSEELNKKKKESRIGFALPGY